jgi:hypothetical protein|tara:strand:- start:578 stop:994 length:417 start_codon:yes stop_codon:yes gene_type:complete
MLFGFLLIVLVVTEWGCREKEEIGYQIISSDSYKGEYRALELQYVGQGDSFGEFIHDTLIFIRRIDTVVLQIRTDSIFLSGSNIKRQYINSGNADSVRFIKKYGAEHYEYHGYMRDTDSLFYDNSWGDLNSTFKGGKM